MTRDKDYDALFEEIGNKYEPRALGLLQRIRNTLREAHMFAYPPFGMCDDQYRWSMVAWRTSVAGAPEESIDISISIAEEREHDGAEGYGLNFSLDIVEYGGKIIGGLQPYNYTSEVWVDARDLEAVEERWLLIEDADLSSIPSLIREAT